MLGEILRTWGPLVLSFVASGGFLGFLKIIVDRKMTAATAQLQTATAGKTAVEGEVTQSADDRAWVTQAREDVRLAQENARTEIATAKAEVDRYKTIADDCRASSWRAQDSAAECRTENAALRERVEQLEMTVRDCPRSGCPLRPLITTVEGK